jgi:hypothetical protein
MPEETVVVAEFESAGQAQFALSQLQAESIQAVILNEEANAANFSVFGRMPYAPLVQVVVPASVAERARELLRSKPGRLQNGWEGEAEQMKGWICHLCDTFVEEDVQVCPACGEARGPESRDIEPRQKDRKKKP